MIAIIRSLTSCFWSPQSPESRSFICPFPILELSKAQRDDRFSRSTIPISYLEASKDSEIRSGRSFLGLPPHMSTTILATNPQVTYIPPVNWQQQFNSSSKSTFHAGSFASLNFTGSQIDVFGSVPTNRTNFQRHGSVPDSSVVFIVDSENFPKKFHRMEDPQFNTLFFSHTFPTLYDSHTLVIKSQGGPLILNSIVISNFTNLTTSTQGSYTPQPTSYSSPDSSTGSTARSGNSPSTKADTIGGIVGGVIAGLVVLACLVVFLLYRRRKRVKAARSASPFAVTPFITEFSKPSSPEPLKSIPTTGAVPTLPFASPPIITELDHGDELPPAFIAGPSDLGRHGSMYKPRQSVDSLPPTEFGYGGGMSREEWARYTLKSKS